MQSIHVLILALLALGMSVGQVLLKTAAVRIGPLWRAGQWIAAAMDPYLLVALAVYAATTLAYLWVLGEIELARAYPFVILGFIFTPLLAVLFLGESVSGSYVLGLVLIVAGLYFVQS